jgi:hypothetical protein
MMDPILEVGHDVAGVAEPGVVIGGTVALTGVPMMVIVAITGEN